MTGIQDQHFLRFDVMVLLIDEIFAPVAKSPSNSEHLLLLNVHKSGSPTWKHSFFNRCAVALGHLQCEVFLF